MWLPTNMTQLWWTLIYHCLQSHFEDRIRVVHSGLRSFLNKEDPYFHFTLVHTCRKSQVNGTSCSLFDLHPFHEFYIDVTEFVKKKRSKKRHLENHETNGGRVSIQGVKSLWGDRVVFPRLGTGNTDRWQINLCLCATCQTDSVQCSRCPISEKRCNPHKWFNSLDTNSTIRPV